MHYYTNTEISKFYGVSKATVTNWITSAKEGRNALELIEVNKKFRIVKSTHNTSEIARLRQAGEAHKNKTFHTVISPAKLFYSAFSTNQVIDMVRQLGTTGEIPLKYRYLDDGANLFDNMVTDGLDKGYFPYPVKESSLLLQAFDCIKEKTKQFEKINIIDIGPGNGLVVKDLLGKILDIDKMGKYISVDISQQMASVAIKNISSWYPNIDIESHARDIEQESFADISFKAKNAVGQKRSINVFLFMGCTMAHVDDKKEVLHKFREAMDKNDLFIFSGVLDKNTDFRTESKYLSYPFNTLPFSTWIPKTLGIDVGECKILTKFDTATQTKINLLKLDKDYTINFEFDRYVQKVTLKKNSLILIHKFYLFTLLSLVSYITDAQLKLVQQTCDDMSFISICELESIRSNIGFDL